MPQQEYRKIFVLYPYGIGDLVLALPTLHSLRRNLPDSEINIGISVPQYPLAKTLEGTVVDKVTLQKYRGNRVLDILHFIKRIREYGPDLFVEFGGAYRFAAAGYFSSARHIHPCYEDTRPGVRILNPERLRASESLHHVDRFLQLINHLGFSVGEILFNFPIPEQDINRALDLVKSNELEERKLVGIVADSSQQFKDWPSCSLRETLDILINDMGYTAVIFGKYKKNDLGGKGIIDLSGKSSLLADSYLLRDSGLFDVTIGVDTGMMHIAGSVSSNRRGNYDYGIKGNPTVSLFGPTDPKRVRPYDPSGRFNIVVQPNVDGIRRDYAGYASDRYKINHMEKLKPSTIVEAVEHHQNQRLSLQAK